MNRLLGPIFTIRLLWIMASRTFAYLDPSSASILIQVLLGGVAGIAVVVKIFWYRIANALGIRRGYAENAQDDDPS